jgi:hypothetical protein
LLEKLCATLDARGKMTQRWRVMMAEPKLDDLLDDDVMESVMRSAGIDGAELRARLAAMARCLPPDRFTPQTECSRVGVCRPREG